MADKVINEFEVMDSILPGAVKGSMTPGMSVAAQKAVVASALYAQKHALKTDEQVTIRAIQSASNGCAESINVLTQAMAYVAWTREGLTSAQDMRVALN